MSKPEEIKKQILGLVSEYHRLVHGVEKPFAPGSSRVNYGGRQFDDQELLNLTEATLEFWLTSGRWTREFERKLAAFQGLKHCLLVNSGSSANLLAFMALTSPLLGERRVRPGDEVVTVAAGFPTTVAPVVQHGAIPVFVDISLPTANLDLSLLEAAVGPKTKAVFLAHTLGNPFDVAAVKACCDAHGLWLVEDNCDALGSLYHGRPTGSFGDIGTSSFYPPHHITMGEGGAVYTDNHLLAKIMRSLRDWGRECECDSGQDNKCGRRFSGQFGSLPAGYDHKYVYSHFGYNLKATDLQAAVGCAQLDKLPAFVAARRRNWQFLHDALAPYAEHFILPEPQPGSEPSWFGFMPTVRSGAPFTRNALVRHIEDKNIQTRMLFAGNIVRHPCFATLAEGKDYRLAGPLANTDKVMDDAFWLGVYPGMTQPMLDYMAAQIESFLKTGALK